MKVIWLIVQESNKTVYNLLYHIFMVQLVQISGCINDSTSNRWFSIFKDCDFNLSDKNIEVRHLNWHYIFVSHQWSWSTLGHYELSIQINCCHKTISNYVHNLWKSNRHCFWIPHEFSRNSKLQRSPTSAQCYLKTRCNPLSIESTLVTKSLFNMWA